MQPQMMKAAQRLRLVTVAAACLLCGCNFQRLAVNQTAALLQAAMPAFESESDHELAAAFPASLKTMEGLLQSAPDNQDLLLVLARGYAGYAMVVLEDRLDQLPDLTSRSEQLRQRVRATYLRAQRYGLRLLDLRVTGFGNALDQDIRKLKRLLARCDKQEVPALFWTGLALASALNVARDDVGLIAKAAHVGLITERVVALDEGYYYGGAHLVLGAMQGSSGALTGGNAQGCSRRADHGAGGGLG